MDCKRISGLLIGLVLTTASAQADLADARRMFQQGQFQQALYELDGLLANDPNGSNTAELRFMKGLSLVSLNRVTQAISVFEQMTRDFPKRPEPYNNLAVLYAQQQQFDKARQALESAIATNPTYATAHENLGDIYAALASMAYDRALKLDGGNQQVRVKLDMLNNLNGPVQPAQPTAVAAAAPAQPSYSQPAPAYNPPTPVVQPAQLPVAPTYPAVAAAPSRVPEPVAAVAPVAVTPTPTAAAAPRGVVYESEIVTALHNWAAAWSAQDVPNYLAIYASNYETPNNMSRSAWERQRASRVRRPSVIQVTVDDEEIILVGNGIAEATFVQNYRSDSYRDRVRKRLLMQYEDGAWKIVREQTLNVLN